MGRHHRARSASLCSSTDSDPLHRPLLQEAASEDDIEALRSVYSRSSSDSSASSITGFERVGADIRGFYKYIKGSILKPFKMEKNGKHERCRAKARRWLGSKYQHYLLIILISLDVSCIFADIFISLYTCEEGKNRSETTDRRIERTQEALAIISLVFSCIFLAELIVTLWAFGLRYLKSKFHIFDAIVIIAGFVVDVVLRGVNSEVASLVVLLRLWRFVKIIEEIGNGAGVRVEELEERIGKLEEENSKMAGELASWRRGDVESQVGSQRRLEDM